MKSQASPLIGSSPASEALRSELARVAPTDVTLLLEGEHGVGKSHLARWVHHQSPRAAGPLIEVDLAALAPSLVESELFGHEEGAFTGASGARLGRFRRAEGGTLVLEGIETLPQAFQGKLLRVLQERRIAPLGAEQELPIDVRVIATAGVSLLAAVRRGAFREDLYYRLAVVVLQVPPLRSRGEDMLDLAEASLPEVAQRLAVPQRALDAGARDKLASHSFPGNVRELYHALERSLVLSRERPPGEPLVAQDFAFFDGVAEGVPERLAREALAFGLGVEELTGALLEVALAEERGNVAAAARRVGLTRKAFEYRLAKRTPAETEEPAP